MKVQVFKAWDRVRSSFWFLPAVMAGGAMVLAFATVALDAPVADWLSLNWGWTFTGGAEGASSLLGAIAGSMITIAGVVFSMTLVALSLASSQLGPQSKKGSKVKGVKSFVVLQSFVCHIRRYENFIKGGSARKGQTTFLAFHYQQHIYRFFPKHTV